MSGADRLADLAARPGAWDAATGLRVAGEAARASGRPLLIESAPDGTATAAAIRSVRETPEALVVDAPAMALLGPLSPLPPAYGEIAARARRRRAGGLAAFADVFTDRLTHLFVAAVECYDVARQLQWQSGRGRIRGVLRALVGLAPAALADTAPLPDDGTLRYAGLLAQRTRSAAGLRALAQAELGLPVEVEQFRLRWRALPATERTRMDGTARLGLTASAGSHVPDRAGQVRLRVGPVRYPDFLSLEAGRPRMEALRRLVRFYLGPVIDFDVQIVLDRRDVPETRLGGDGPAPRLGWNVWARSLPAARDADEAVVGSGRVPERAAA